MLLGTAMCSSRHHAAVIPPLPVPPVDPLVPFNDLTFGTTKSIAIEDRAAAYTHMPRHNLFPFALTECGNGFPWYFPPRGGLHGSQFPIGRIDDGQSAFRVAHPP